MPALTEAQLEELQAQAPRRPNPFTAEPTFPYDPSVRGLPETVQNMLRLIGNVPHSSLNVARSMVEMGRDPVMVGQTLLQGLTGVPEAVRRMFGDPMLAQMPESINASIARQLGEFYIDRLKNPMKTLVEDPAGAALDLSGLGVLGKVGQIPMAGALSRMSPLRTVPEGIAGGAKALGGAAKFAGEQAAGFSTGFEPGHFRRASAAGRAGGVRSEGFTSALRERHIAEDVLDDFRQSIERVRELRRSEYRAQLPTIALKAGQSLDLDQIRNALLNRLRDDYRVGYSIMPAGEVVLDFSRSKLPQASHQRRVQRLVKDLFSWTDNTPEGIDTLKQRIGEWHEPGERFARSNAIIDTVYGDVRDMLVAKVDGYGKLVNDYEYLSKHLRAFETILSGKSINPEAALSKLTSIMRDSPTARLRKAIVEDLERMSGQPIADQLAGLDLAQWPPKTLFGRGIALGIAKQMEWIDVPTALGMLAMTSPHVMGEFFHALGVGQRQVDNVVRFMEKLWSALPADAAVDGLTVAAAVEKARLSGQ